MEGQIFMDIHRLIEENDFTEYCELVDYLLEHNKKRYFEVVSNEKNVLHFTSLLESRRRQKSENT